MSLKKFRTNRYFADPEDIIRNRKSFAFEELDKLEAFNAF